VLFPLQILPISSATYHTPLLDRLQPYSTPNSLNTLMYRAMVSSAIRLVTTKSAPSWAILLRTLWASQASSMLDSWLGVIPRSRSPSELPG
jgi:hypothetical protein